ESDQTAVLVGHWRFRVKVAVVGAGAVGGLLSGMLARAGEEVVFLGRGETRRALEERGLEVVTPLGEFTVRRIVASSEPAALGPADVVVVGVRAWQVAGIAASLQPLVKEGSSVVPVQNGVEAADQLQAALPSGSVIGGVCHVISRVDKPGRIVQKGNPPQMT